MNVGIIRDDDVRAEDGRRIEGALDVDHHAVQLVAVLSANVGCHDAAGAVLGFEAATDAEHEVDHLVRELLVTQEAARVVEALIEKKVDVAILGVTEDDGILVPVPREQLLESGASGGERRYRN